MLKFTNFTENKLGISSGIYIYINMCVLYLLPQLVLPQQHFLPQHPFPPLNKHWWQEYHTAVQHQTGQLHNKVTFFHFIFPYKISKLESCSLKREFHFLRNLILKYYQSTESKWEQFTRLPTCNLKTVERQVDILYEYHKI